MAATSKAKTLHTLLECSICLESYRDPRSLPCVHTFCLQCIEGVSRDKHPGDSLDCPLCRKEFTIPDGGVAHLPKNFSLSNKWYTIDYDNWIPLHRQGRAPNGTTTAIGVSIVSRDPKLLLRIQHLIRDAKFTRISRTKYTLEVATVNGF